MLWTTERTYNQKALASAKTLYPGQIVEPDKARPEMIHRYFAGSFCIVDHLVKLESLMAGAPRSAEI